MRATITGRPVAYARTRHRGGQHYKPRAHRAWEARAVAIMRAHAPAEPLHTAVAVRIEAHWPAPRKADEGTHGSQTREDIDNVAKLVLDAAVKAGWLVDDNHVADLHVIRWRCARGAERVEVSAHPCEPVRRRA